MKIGVIKSENGPGLLHQEIQKLSVSERRIMFLFLTMFQNILCVSDLPVGTCRNAARLSVTSRKVDSKLLRKRHRDIIKDYHSMR